MVLVHSITETSRGYNVTGGLTKVTKMGIRVWVGNWGDVRERCLVGLIRECLHLV